MGQMTMFPGYDDRIKDDGDGGWLVASKSSPGQWHSVDDRGRCTCPAYEHRRTCRHTKLLIEQGRLVVEAPVSNIKPTDRYVVPVSQVHNYGIVTASYANRMVANDLVLPVQTSLGLPRYNTSFTIVATMADITPDRWMLGLSYDDYKRSYINKIERVGIDAIVDTLDDLSRANDGKPVCLMCFENIVSPNKQGQYSWCHRDFLANFITEGTGLVVPELATA